MTWVPGYRGPVPFLGGYDLKFCVKVAEKPTQIPSQKNPSQKPNRFPGQPDLKIGQWDSGSRSILTREYLGVNYPWGKGGSFVHLHMFIAYICFIHAVVCFWFEMRRGGVEGS